LRVKLELKSKQKQNMAVTMDTAVININTAVININTAVININTAVINITTDIMDTDTDTDIMDTDMDTDTAMEVIVVAQPMLVTVNGGLSDQTPWLTCMMVDATQTMAA